MVASLPFRSSIPVDYSQATVSNVKAPPAVCFLSFIVLHTLGCLSTLHKSFLCAVQRFQLQTTYDAVHYSSLTDRSGMSTHSGHE